MAKRRHISIKNFTTYQHYSHRHPPWIKLHLSLLDDPAFLKLPDESKWHYVGLLLLASRHANAIPYDPSYIVNRLGITSKLDITHGFLKDHVLAPPCFIKQTYGASEESRDRVETEESSQPNLEASKIRLTPSLLLDTWNEKRQMLPKAITLTERRARHAKARLLKHPSIEYWRDVFDRIQLFPFLTGENDRGWRCTIDWIIANDDNHIKVLEGEYGKMQQA